MDWDNLYYNTTTRQLTTWLLIKDNCLRLQLEAGAIKMSSLPALVLSDFSPAAKWIQQNFILKNYLEILNQIKGTCQFPSLSIQAKSFNFSLHT